MTKDIHSFFDLYPLYFCLNPKLFLTFAQENEKMEKYLYNDFSRFLAKFFDGKIQKIAVNAGFSCPNRDGSIGRGGCAYCNNHTFNPDYCATEISVCQQLQEGKDFFSSKYPEMRYLAYFQAYTRHVLSISLFCG